MRSVIAPSLPLRLYRRLVPADRRERIRERLPVGTHLVLARLLTRAGGWNVLLGPVRAWQHRAWRRAGFPRVNMGRKDVYAVVHPAPTPTAARRENARFVSEVLAGAGIGYFFVRGKSDHGTAVAVSVTDRDAVRRALLAAFRSTPGYLARVTGTQAGRVHRADAESSWRTLASATTIRVIRYLTDPAGVTVHGGRYGCDVEFWTEEEGWLRAPRPNRVSEVLPPEGALVDAPEPLFTRSAPRGHTDTPHYRTREEFLGTLLDEITFPIDVVYTWVDGSDPAWRARRAERELGTSAEPLSEQAANESRYFNRDELRYSLRSVYEFAPWVNHIYLVTDQQVPAWLDPDHPGITVVDHREIFAYPDALPTFNSHAIESQLYRIEGLTEHFLYFNDDILLGRPVVPTQFFHASGMTKCFPSPATVDPTPPGVLDTPASAAGKNGRQLLLGRYQRRVTQKMKHCPYALRRSILAEITEAFPAELGATTRHPFRHPEDVSLTSAMYHNYAQVTGRATTGQISYMYTDLSAPKTPQRLRMALARRNFDVMCLNDTDATPEDLARQHIMLSDFLAAYYPLPAPWERSPDRAATVPSLTPA